MSTFVKCMCALIHSILFSFMHKFKRLIDKKIKKKDKRLPIVEKNKEEVNKGDDFGRLSYNYI